MVFSTQRVYCLVFFLTLMALSSSGQQPYFWNYQIQDGLPSNQVYDIIQDNQGYIWLGTDSGISAYDGFHFSNFTTQDGLADNEVFQLYEDSRERLWFLTFNGKPGYLKDGTFFHSGNDSLLATINFESFLSSISEDSLQQAIYLASINGKTIRIDFNHSTVTTIPFKQKHYETTNAIWLEKEGAVGRIAVNRIEVFQKNQALKQIAAIENNPSLIKTFLQGDSLFFTSQNKIRLYNRATQVLQDSFRFDFINSEIIRIYLHQQTLWVGTRDGVFQIALAEFKKNNPTYQKYLDQQSVSGILIDRESNWWFSTLESGIYFVPSPEIIRYTTNEGLPLNRIHALSMDAHRRLWMGFDKNYFAVLDGKKLKTTRLEGRGNNGREIIKIRQLDEDQTLIIGKDISMLWNDSQANLLCSPGTDMIQDTSGNWWVGMRRLHKYPAALFKTLLLPLDQKYASKKKSLLEMNLGEIIVSNSRVTCLEIDDNQTIWVGTPDALYFLDGNSKDTFQRTSTPLISKKIVDMIFDASTKNLWVATDLAGVYLIRDKKVIQHLDIKDGLTSDICTDICLDKKHQIWVTTINGLNKIVADRNTFFVYNLYKSGGLAKEKLNAVEVDDSHVYLGTDFGLSIVPKKLFLSPTKAPMISLHSFQVAEREELRSAEKAYPHFENSVSFSFTGLSFKDHGNLSYQYILHGQDETWEQTSSRKVLYKSLPPGDYTFEVKAINGHGVSSEKTAQITFHINKAFWQEIWFITLSTLFVLSLILLLGYWRETRIRQKYELQNRLFQTAKEKMEIEKRFTDLKISALQLQMNPHFIFNALNTIKGYYTSAQLREGSQFVNKFSKLLRLILEYSNKYIPLDREIELLRLYLELSQTRYPDLFEFHIEIDAGINPHNITIPSMLLQPFVENAIIHGLVPKGGSGQVCVCFKEQDALLLCSIRDNGIGREASQKINKPKQHRSLAIQITRDRLSILNKGVETADTFNIQDIDKPNGEKGTFVVLKIPFKKNW